MAVYVFCKNTRLLIILQPLKTTLVRQVLNLEMLEFSLKAVAIGAGSHHTNHNGRIVLDRPIFRLVEPLHALKRLRRQSHSRDCKNKS